MGESKAIWSLTSLLIICSSSEFINAKDVPQVIASCFKYPFSKPGVNPLGGHIQGPETPSKRNVVLVGHDVGADINFLRNMGYNVYNLPNLLELADTAAMFRYLKREANPRTLAVVLAELGLTGWNLHNAGNDAMYTLQAMIGIAFRHLDEKHKHQEEKERERKARIEEYGSFNYSEIYINFHLASSEKLPSLLSTKRKVGAPMARGATVVIQFHLLSRLTSRRNLLTAQ